MYRKYLAILTVLTLGSAGTSLDAKPQPASRYLLFGPPQVSIELGHMITFAATIGDQDGDLVPDIAHGGTYANGGVVSPISGKTIYPLYSPSYIKSFDSTGDFDGDGFPDLVLGGASYDGGICRILSGANFEPIFELGDSDYEFATSVAAVDDIDGDDLPEILLTNPYEDNGWVGIWGSSSQDFLFRNEGTEELFAFWADALSDVTGDNKGDIATFSPSFIEGEETQIPGWRIDVYSGDGGALVWSRFVEAETETVFAVPFRTVGDLNDDGIEDIAAGFTQSNQVRIYSGRRGRELFRIQGPEGKFGFSIAGGQDLNGDGIGDLIVGAPTYGNPPQEGEPSPGAVFIYSGRSTARPVSSSTLVPTLRQIGAIRGYNHDFGRRVEFFEDLNQDGYPEVGVVSDDFIYSFTPIR